MKLEFNKWINTWDEAIPLGNGKIGCLIWGASEELRFSIDRGDVWDKTPYQRVLEDDFTYAELIRLAKAGKEQEIRDIFDAPYNHPLPSKLPAGKLIFNFGKSENVISKLDILTGEAEIDIVKDEPITINSFIHATGSVGFVKISMPMAEVKMHISNPEFSVGENDAEITMDSVNTGSLKLLKYPAPIIVDSGDEKYFIQKIDANFSYGIFMQMKERDGKTEIAYTVANTNDGENWAEKARKSVLNAVNKGYEKEIISHKKWWSEYFEESSVSLPDEMFQRNWYLINYLFASCSRKGEYPMPLQGLWTADDGQLPPWKGDYHHDLNTEMSYYHFFKANHLEEGESFIDYLWSLKGKAEEFAKRFYGTDGLCLPAVMTIDAQPLGGWPMYALVPTNQIWLCQTFERYYRFTGNKRFLSEKAYPYLSGTAKCIMGLLQERDGKLYLPISSSPEIHDDTIKSWLTPNSNYDLSLMKYLFTQLIDMAQILKNGEEDKWREILNKLPELAVNKDNVYMLSSDESLNESHRHLSHLMAIHPLRLVDMTNAKEIIDASILNLEQLGTGYWVGFSFVWMAELYAVQRNGNGAFYQLRSFFEHICSQNGFNFNGDYKKSGVSQFHYRPFTLDATMAAADAIQEMLLYSEKGEIELFPSIPEHWLEETIAFENLRAQNGILVSAKMEKGKIVSLILSPTISCNVKIINLDKEFELVAGGRYTII